MDGSAAVLDSRLARSTPLTSPTLPGNYLEFSIDQYRLANGLRVVLHPDLSIPIVAVNLWYHVGSKDESKDRTGLAHLFEHLMFEGSANHDDEYFRPLQEAGGSINGSTSHDRTNYYEVVPSNFLELALWMEADRMGHLLPVLSSAKLENQRSVVKNERRQRIDNQPYGKVGEELAGLLYPAGHPYSWPVIGWMEHLDAMSMDDVRGFFQSFYTPANVSLIVSGDFDEKQTRRWIDQYFGPIPAGPPITIATADVPKLDGVQRRRLDDAVALPRLDIVWPTPARFHPDEPALDFAAQILAGGSKDSRLRRRLVYEERLVTSIGAGHHTLKLNGQFVVRAHGLPETPIEKVEAAVLEEIEKLSHEPPTDDEMETARHRFLNQAYSRVETVLGRADSLNHYLFYQDKLSRTSFIDELNAYLRVQREDVSASLRRHLGPGRAVVEVHPLPDTKAAPRSAPPPDDADVRNRPKKSSDGGKSWPLPSAGPAPSFSLPTIERSEAAGLKIALVQWPKLPRVDFLLLFDAGSIHDPLGKIGLARLTADLVDEGTAREDGLAIARRLDRLGASLSASMGLESATISLRSLSHNLADSFGIFSEVIQGPRFAATDIERERKRLLAELAHRSKQPAALADDAIDIAIFGADHPYGRPSDGIAQDLETIGPADLADFYRRLYRPAGATLIVVGAITMDEVRRLVEDHLTAWTSDRGRIEPFAVGLPEGNDESIRIIERSGSTQSVVRVGRSSVPRYSPDYFPLLLVNTILGGQFSSRLNHNLREEKGYTYGARSYFSLRRSGGVFAAGADVQSSATAEAVQEFLNEIAGIAGERPITAAEMAYAKAFLSRRFPARFETGAGIISHLAQLAVYGLPDDYYDTYLSQLDAVTLADANRAARERLSLDAMKVVVVADPSVTATLDPVRDSLMSARSARGIVAQ